VSLNEWPHVDAPGRVRPQGGEGGTLEVGRGRVFEGVRVKRLDPKWDYGVSQR